MVLMFAYLFEFKSETKKVHLIIERLKVAIGLFINPANYYKKEILIS